jgi:hypothetical protein
LKDWYNIAGRANKWNNKLYELGTEGKDEHHAVSIREEKRGEKKNS